MKTRFFFIACAAVAVALTSCNSKPDYKVKLKTEIDSVSYSIGANIGQNVKREKNLENLNIDALARGLSEAIDDKSLFTEQEISEIINNFFQKSQMKQMEENKANGEKFLEENKNKEGVQVTPSGLQYQVITQGDGAVPDSSSMVTVHYTGTLIDGTEFESTAGQEPVSFRADRVIPGWTEALLMMNVGSKYKLFIPSELGYGANPRPGGPIEPNSTLIFEVELISIGEDTENK
jgi:FKBP-type peptidyl-prolyl cis-trans isomerase